MSQEKIEERRKHHRFRPAENTFVVAARSIGRILDISKGGMAFSYLRLQEGSLSSAHLDVMVDGNPFLANIPIRTIAEDRLETKFATSPMEVGRCRVEFGLLNADQLKVIAEFIEQHTKGAGPAMAAASQRGA
jgi:hypothetical protein